jgi:basic amino acid/polyamine antiporter, APA family
MNQSPTLRRQLGLASAAAAVAGESIAVGIFLTPAGMARSLGSPGWLLAIWLALGAMTLSGALCYGELATRYPQSGGTYVYLREAFGPGLAFLYGWMCLLVLDPGLAAALATGLTAYAAYIFHWSHLASKFAAISILAALCLLNTLSTAVSAGFMRWITWLKCGVLAFLVIFAIVFRLGSWSHFVPFWTPRPGSLPFVPALASAMVAGFFSFGGWWDVSKIAGEIRDPQRTLPRALILGVIVVTVLYISISAVFLYLVPLQSVTSDETFVAQAGAVLFGSAGGNILAAIVIVCVLGSLAVFTMAAPRVYYAMANDGLFLHAVARPHPRFGTPANAILLQGAIACLLVAIGNFQQIIAYFIFVAVLFLGLAVAGLFVLRRRHPADPSAIRTPGFPLTPIAFLALVLLLLALLGLRNPVQAAYGCVVVLIGLPVYFFLRKSHRDLRN